MSPSGPRLQRYGIISTDSRYKSSMLAVPKAPDLVLLVSLFSWFLFSFSALSSALGLVEPAQPFLHPVGSGSLFHSGSQHLEYSIARHGWLFGAHFAFLSSRSVCFSPGKVGVLGTEEETQQQQQESLLEKKKKKIEQLRLDFQSLQISSTENIGDFSGYRLIVSWSGHQVPGPLNMCLSIARGPAGRKTGHCLQNLNHWGWCLCSTLS